MYRKNNQGQIQGQPLIYLLTIVIMASVLIFGYNAVSELIAKQKQIQLLQFESYIQSEADKMSSQYGSTKEVKLIVPSDYTEICFIDSYTDTISASNELKAGESHPRPIVHENWDKGTSKDVFLIDRITDYRVDIGMVKVSTTEHYLCVEVTGGVARIKMRGGGDHAIIMDAQ